MATDMMDRAPEGLRSLYAEDLGPAPFTVDDVVSGGRRRQRRRAAGAIGAAVAAAAVVGVGATSVWGGASADHRPVQPARTTGPTTYPGCATQPDTCAAVVAAWSREVAGSVAAVRTVSAAKYQEGTRVLTQQVGAAPGGEPVDIRVVISPSSTASLDEAAVDRVRNLVRLPGLPVAVDRWTVQRKGSAFDRFTVPKGDFARSVGVQVDVTGGAPGGGPSATAARDVRTPTSWTPTWWTPASVGDLVTRIYGTDAVAVAQPSVEQGVAGQLRSVGCSLDQDKCTLSMWSTWARRYLDQTIVVEDWQRFVRVPGGNDWQGYSQLASIGGTDLGQVTLSVGEDVDRYGGVFGDATGDPGQVRTVQLPFSGRAEVHSWLDGDEKRVLWLVHGNGTDTGPRRLLVRSFSHPAPSGPSARQVLPGWSDAAAVALLEAVR